MDNIVYECIFKDGFIKVIEAKDIYNAVCQIVEFEGVSPTLIKSIAERW